MLDVPGPDSAGRYHRPGQPALYIACEVDWAVIATARYMADEPVPRVAVPLRVSEAFLLDQRDGATCRRLGIDAEASRTRWQIDLAEGREPLSWANSDVARAIGADGVVDPSRGILDGWYVALFRWNAPGAPVVELDGEPVEVDYLAARARWPSPPGWLAVNGDITY